MKAALSRPLPSAAWVLMLGALYCGSGSGKPPAASRVVHHTSENWVGPPLPKGRVILTDVYGGPHAVDVEVAATDPMRERGMMWRKALPEGKGMLFVFPTEEEHSFWMRNTLIPLDMVFIDGKGSIVGIVENAQPRSLASHSVGVPSKYVLEVPGGWCQKVGIRPGTRAVLQGIDRIAVQ
ncbi:MAG TPA: DUF192 domain-containing protein [Myxococcaceae bacterium]|nr:DUF192 domain-containing protein [Myxococcaceae bacterium]